MSTELLEMMTLRQRREALTPERLRDLLHYDPETGIFTRKVRTSNRVKVGDVAGYTDPKGYLRICVDGVALQAHRLAWLYVHGAWPVGECDHEDGVRNHNWIENLRDETTVVNQHNQKTSHKQNKTGLLGASFHKTRGKYVAQIKAGPAFYFLGYHDTAEAAHAAYVCAKRQLHPEATL